MNFQDAFAYVHGVEGNLSLDPQDPGNWTGGKVGVGVLKGTKYGVSAAAYPALDIANLSLSDAQSIFKRDYWDKVGGDLVPYGAALLLVDFGYNAGTSESIRCAQRALGLQDDGVLGPITLGALRYFTPSFALSFTVQRVLAYTEMPNWSRNRVGWTTRAITTYTKAVS